MKEADSIYQKAGVMLIALPILGVAFFALGRIDILPQCFLRVDIFLYYLATLVVIVSLATSVISLFLCVYPRSYDTLANMGAWHKWQEDYRKYIENRQAEEKFNRESTEDMDAAMFKELLTSLVKAQPKNAKINEKRNKAFQTSLKWAGIAAIAIGVEAISLLALRIQGV
jgi:hypothetical protein